MNLVEAEATSPVEADALADKPVVTPPRPLHRRVSVSLLFTVSVLVGLVVMVYMVFPARHHVLLTEALDRHEAHDTVWQHTAPSRDLLVGFATGVAGKEVPLPPEGVKVVGVSRDEALEDTVVLGLRIGGDDITMFVQHARGMAPEHAERDDGDTKAIAWRIGAYECVAVGPAATSATWISALTR